MQRIRPSLQIYGALFGSLTQGERWADVLTYLDRMVADGVVPDASATNTAVFAAAKLGDGRRALSLLEGEAGRNSLQRRQQQQKRKETEQQQQQHQGQLGRGVGKAVGGGGEDDGYGDALGEDKGQEVEQVLVREGSEGEEGVGRGGDGGMSNIEQRVEELLEKRLSARVGVAGVRERGGQGAKGVGIVAEQPLSRSSGAAHVQAPTMTTPPTSDLRGECRGEVAGKPHDISEAGEGEGRGRRERNGGSADDGGAGGGWETATPGLLNAVLHALDEAGDDAGVLAAVKRGREKRVLLNPNIYR